MVIADLKVGRKIHAIVGGTIVTGKIIEVHSDCVYLNSFRTVYHYQIMNLFLN